MFISKNFLFKLSYNVIILSIVFLNIVTCKSQKQQNKITQIKALFTNEADCAYALDSKNSVSATWTAYKFTEKVGITGDFTNPQATSTISSANTLEELLEHTQVSIELTEIDSKNPVRDLNIKNAFKKEFAKTKVTANINTQKFHLNQVMTTFRINEIQKDLIGYISKESNISKKKHNSIELAISSQIDLRDFKGSTFLKEISVSCGKELHTGKNLKEKMWPDIRTKIVFHITKTCK